MKKKKKSRVRKIVLPVLLVLVIAGAALFFLRHRGQTPAGSPLAANTTVEAAHPGTIRITTEGNGSIEAAQETPVAADYTLKIDTVEAENGDVVSEGDVLATLDADSIDDQIDAYESQLSEVNSAISGADRSGSDSLTAPVSGRVKRIFAREGEVIEDVVAEHGGVMELSADGRLRVEFTSSRRLKPGDEVTVSFLSYEEDGTVMSAENGVYTVTIEDGANYLVDTEATVMDEDEVTLGRGYLKSNHPYLVEGAYGVVDEISVDVGDYADSGSTLLTRTDTEYNGSYLALLDEREELTGHLQELRALQKDPALRAPAGGIVSELTLADGTPVAEDSLMYKLISTDRFWLKTEIDELDIVGVTEGQTAAVVFDAFDTEEYEGKVEKISALGQNVNGVTKYTVTISVPGIDKVRTAMSATATIVTDERENTLLIPVDAVQTVDGETCVTVVDGETQKAVPVTLGLVNNTEAEVLSGLSEGDQVLVVGKSDMEIMMDMMKQSREQFRGGED